MSAPSLSVSFEIQIPITIWLNLFKRQAIYKALQWMACALVFNLHLWPNKKYNKKRNQISQQVVFVVVFYYPKPIRFVKIFFVDYICFDSNWSFLLLLLVCSTTTVPNLTGQATTHQDQNLTQVLKFRQRMRKKNITNTTMRKIYEEKWQEEKWN